MPLHLDVHPSYADYAPDVAVWSDQFERADAILALGADAMVEVWLPDPALHPEVSVRRWREPARADDMPLLYVEYETPAGALRQVIRETPDLYTWHKINRNTCGPLADRIDGVGLLEDSNPSRSVEYLIKGPEDLPKLPYLFQVPPATVLRAWREQAEFAKRAARERETVFLARRTYCGAALLWLTDAVESICTFETDPDYIAAFLRIIHNWQMQMLPLVLDLDVDMVTRFGYYDIPDFWGRKYFDRLLRPLMEEEAGLVHAGGALLCQQQSEGLTQLSDIYAGIPVDILRDIDPVQGGEDLAQLKAELGDTKTLMGGINTDLMLTNSKPAEIERTVRETIELMAPGGGFILHPIPGVYAGVPWDKILCLVESWKKYA